MIILKQIVKFIKTLSYKKYRNRPCPKCGSKTWKYSFAPYVIRKKKGLIEVRVCGECSYKDPMGHFLDSDLGLGNDVTFINKNK